VLITALILVATQSTQAQTFNVLHTFTGGGDGADPVSSLTLDGGGHLYGTAYAGGINSPDGTVFRVTHTTSGWVLSPIFEFADNVGAQPAGPVIFGADGTLYGTTIRGGAVGNGTVFRLQPPASACQAALCYWSETLLYSFASGPDGHRPTGNIIFDRAGNLYGTTESGGTHGDGTVYKLSQSGGQWTEQVLYSFTGGDDGLQPYSGVIMDNLGNLYGTALYGGGGNCPSGCGTVFELSPSGSGWVESTLYQLRNSPNNYKPIGGLIFDPSGNFDGTTYYGGAGGGTVFELSRTGGSWSFTVLYNLSGNGYGPTASLTRDSAGNLYGTTINLLFKLMSSGGRWTLTDLHDFSTNDGYYSWGSVIFDSQGNIYGTASAGGTDEQGTVWEFAP
jgi:uncharacterized repeat protein (TIGR03803 family)